MQTSLLQAHFDRWGKDATASYERAYHYPQPHAVEAEASHDTRALASSFLGNVAVQLAAQSHDTFAAPFRPASRTSRTDAWHMFASINNPSFRRHVVSTAFAVAVAKSKCYQSFLAVPMDHPERYVNSCCVDFLPCREAARRRGADDFCIELEENIKTFKMATEQIAQAQKDKADLEATPERVRKRPKDELSPLQKKIKHEEFRISQLEEAKALAHERIQNYGREFIESDAGKQVVDPTTRFIKAGAPCFRTHHGNINCEGGNDRAACNASNTCAVQNWGASEVEEDHPVTVGDGKKTKKKGLWPFS